MNYKEFVEGVRKIVFKTAKTVKWLVHEKSKMRQEILIC